MSRPWTCPVCQTVIILGEAPADGKICCPTCGTHFAYPAHRDAPLRRESSSGGDDRDQKDRDPDDRGHTPQTDH
jgi:uncharacterized Zn finger protein (UPF0148 family)